MPVVELTTTPGAPVSAYGYRVTPMAQSLRVRLPFFALAWTRPSAMLVQHPDGSQQEVPIVDITRLAQVGLVALTFVLWVLRARLPVRRIRENRR